MFFFLQPFILFLLSFFRHQASLCAKRSLLGFFFAKSNPHTFSIENKPMELLLFFPQPFLNFFFFIIFSCCSGSKLTSFGGSDVQERRNMLQKGRGKRQFLKRSWSFWKTLPWSVMRSQPQRGISMTCLKKLIGNILVNVLAYHQKVITHPCFGLIFFQRFKDNIRFQFAKRSSTIVILAGIISGSNKKTIEIP